MSRDALLSADADPKCSYLQIHENFANPSLPKNDTVPVGRVLVWFGIQPCFKLDATRSLELHFVADFP